MKLYKFTEQDGTTYPPHQKARLAEEDVVNYLQGLGFVCSVVNHVTSNGIDIVAIKSGSHFKIEVKTPTYSARCWKVGKVSDFADFVFVYMPNGHIHVDSAKSWRKIASSDGSVAVTSLVKLYEVM